MPTTVSTPLVVFFLVSIVLSLPALVLPRLLRRRGIDLVHVRGGLGLVFDSEDENGNALRLLNVNGTFQSICYTEEDRRWDLACLYHQYFGEVIDILAETGTPSPSVLVVGGGGFSLPKWLAANRPNVHASVVEIDSKIIELARTRFFLNELDQQTHAEQEGRLNVICGDGWGILQQERHWDVVVNDAFSGKRPLGPMKTERGARIIHERLGATGVYLANVMAPLEGRKSKNLRDTIQVFSQEFTFVYLFPERPEEPTRGGVNALVATDQALPIAEKYRVK